MCGIFAAINDKSVTANLLSGLSLLSYRGYDSAGIAVVNAHGLMRQRAQGKVNNLQALLVQEPLDGTVGIAHTRWATHGLPNERNAHPHMTERVALVHNGIVENYGLLKERLESYGYEFESETDSESIAQLVTYYLDNGLDSIGALKQALAQVEGSYSIAMISKSDPDALYVTRKGNPLVIGKGVNGFYVSSDENALSTMTSSFMHLDDGEVAIINKNSLEVFTSSGKPRRAIFSEVKSVAEGATKEGYQHYMLKEINEQTDVFERCWHSYFDGDSGKIKLPSMKKPLSHYSRLSIVACGTSYYAGMVSKYWVEKFSGVPVDLDIASEYRYREAPIDANSVALFISQSGETADTLAAMRYAQAAGQTCIAMVNVINSTMALEADIVLPTLAGPEIGVASTKAFISQLTCLMMLTMALADANGRQGDIPREQRLQSLKGFKQILSTTLKRGKEVQALSHLLDGARDALFLGRGFSSAIALEGALKLKEISYIHAEAYPAGELKHGPLALVDENMPVIMIAPPDALFGKTLSNLREVASRGGKIILLSNAEGIERSADYIVGSFELPEVDPMLQALLYTIPVQLLAYHCALQRGNDVDQPRNLAKSVTVE